MNILVTGCNGFIGKNMTAFLAAQPDIHVFGWEWTPDKELWPKVIEYDWVIHLGAITSRHETDVEKVLTQNLDFSKWLFKECQHHGTNLQYSSTSEVYGHSRKCSEYSMCYPQSPYAWSKYLFDRWAFERPHTAFVHGFRYFNVYGKWMHLKGDDADMIHKWRQQAQQQGVGTQLIKLNEIGYGLEMCASCT